jgi:hypothetical protein
VKINDAVVRNLPQLEVRGPRARRRWEWTRCKPLMVTIAAIALICYLKWAGFVR